MKQEIHPWNRLVAAARRARDPRDDSAPLGFAARVAARGMTARPAPFWEEISTRLALRALGVACLLALVAASAGYPTLVKIFSAVSTPAPALASAPAAPAAPAAATPASSSSDDPVAEVVGIVS
jgi:hypothetical protein